VNFLRFPAATHILTVNCAEMAGDGPGKPAYNIFLHRTYIFKNLSLIFQDALISYCCNPTLIAKVAGPLLSRVT